MTEINRLRLEFAVSGFLTEMRRQYVKRYPDKDCPVLTLNDYSPEDRASLIAGIEKAIRLSHGTADEAFDAWVKRREESLTP